ncbi:tRNA pseudouridine(55) synthase TruB [Sporanaerobacter sp. PP17-6a]|uniref:tRNA pseudouridine(55) synthase TruB n=1 Tax=Sporanaerobacter sp. PP17-6a TaxID=1891289 RepID=UPI0008A0125F|nr:tRNA pseudouridine(55) synthase TruB [Sporanaerobacter sp. PP17-6a]SCL82908.1 tRNA pseudouridine synthase B [Sporanaerobacter sp. PP17-6a]
MDGIINVFKPKGITSYDVIRMIKKILNIKKVGHTGTLDPNAGGVLPVCVGNATRLSEYILNSKKEYIGELTLGYETDTQDGDGNVIKYSDKIVEEEEIKMAFEGFKGEIEQVPPMYSAIKHNGKKLYELAREGINVERSPRNVTVYDMNIIEIHENKVLFKVLCSRGTYIRTLCNDIGTKLGTYGYMSYLLRTKVGNFVIEDGMSIEELEKKVKNNKFEDFLIPMDEALQDWNFVNVNDEDCFKLMNGLTIDLWGDLKEGLNRVYCQDKFLGIGNIKSHNNVNMLKMKKVLCKR